MEEHSWGTLRCRDERMTLVFECLVEVIFPFSHVVALEELLRSFGFHWRVHRWAMRSRLGTWHSQKLIFYVRLVLSDTVWRLLCRNRDEPLRFFPHPELHQTFPRNFPFRYLVQIFARFAPPRLSVVVNLWNLITQHRHGKYSHIVSQT